MAERDREATLLWLRRDLRLDDHPGWQAALEGGGPVIPVFILDPLVEAQYGAAPRWRLERALESHARDLAAKGSRLILRRGRALDVLRDLIAETGAARVVWGRVYDGEGRRRDTEIKSALGQDGVEARSVNASLLFEPWTVATKTGGFYKVYTPFWRGVRGLDIREPMPAPGRLNAPEAWPGSDRLEDWGLGRAMDRGAEIVARHARIGEARARDRLGAFLADGIERYKTDRDRPDIDGTSRLSDSLAMGEISPVTIWHAASERFRALSGKAAEGAEGYLQELVWREFAYHLLYHTPQLETGNWREEWDDFPWRDANPQSTRWCRGMTGIEMVDAAMREMYVTGFMHNRLRMLVANVLTKHLMTHWRVGERWFNDCLIDWDPASNAMGWQWSAGSGPDATPYFRIFNPETQAKKFDPEGAYRDRFIAEGRRDPHEDALAYFDAVPRSWGLDPKAGYPDPVIGLAEGRKRALEAYEAAREKA